MILTGSAHRHRHSLGYPLGTTFAVAVALAAAMPQTVVSGEGQSLAEWVEALPRAERGSGVAARVPAATATEFAAVIRLAATGRVNEATERADNLAYRVQRRAEAGLRFVVIVPRGDTGPTLIIAERPWRDIVAEAPHSVFEHGTAAQAVRLVSQQGARAALVSGAHRCASEQAAESDGRSRVCNDPAGSGEPQPYRASDAAHATSTLFHAAHRALSQLWPTALVVQFHGMARGRSEHTSRSGWTWFVLSSSTARPPSSKAPLSMRLRDRLRKRIGEGPVRAVSCQDAADQQRFDFRRLCATGNIQAQSLAAASINDSDELPRRFLHIEQRVDPVLRLASRRALTVEAVASLAPCIQGREDRCDRPHEKR